MGADESSIPVGSHKIKINHAIPVSDQITIAIHGKRKVGKTSLIKKMLNVPLSLLYTPTPTMVATEFYWNSIMHPDETIKITVWDVVDSALGDNDDNKNIILPDAQTVDTFTTTDGIIMLYDPNNEETIDYAISIIQKSPENLPLICLANFFDRRKTNKNYLEKFEVFNERIIHVQTSILTNKGLQKIAEWLDIPLLYHREKYYMKCVEIADEQIKDFDIFFNDTIEKMSINLFQTGCEDDDFDEKLDELPSELTGVSNVSFTNFADQNVNNALKKKSDDFMIKLDYNV